ncbi:MAG: peroxiredoxin [Gemmataceae bacterium]|nr:peroxiredoxin [Gemmataceae bacterium]
MLRTAAQLAGLAAAVLLAAPAAAQDDKLKVKEGDKFPAVAVAAAQVEKLPGKKAGDTVSIADFKGKNVVIFFYPRALTKGCTIESCGFRDLAKEFPENTVILGASNDPVAKNQEFIDKEKLPYPLLSDSDSKLVKELGIMSPKGNAAQRVTFVVDKEGKIAKVFPQVNPEKHPKEVLEFVKTLK